jgi:hypothetical protein
MNRSRAARIAASVLALALCETGVADVYTWKDPSTGRTRISNFAPPWYKRGEEPVRSHVVVTRGTSLIDDTRLPLDKRLQLSGASEPRQQEKGNTPEAKTRAPAGPAVPRERDD